MNQKHCALIYSGGSNSESSKTELFKVWFLNGKEFGFRMIGTVQKPNFKMVALS